MQIIKFHLQWVVVQSGGKRLTLWFGNNCVKVNPDKFHLLLNGKISHQVNICNKKFWGIKTDNELTFKEHVEELCKKTVKKSVLWQEFCL